MRNPEPVPTRCPNRPPALLIMLISTMAGLTPSKREVTSSSSYKDVDLNGEPLKEPTESRPNVNQRRRATDITPNTKVLDTPFLRWVERRDGNSSE